MANSKKSFTQQQIQKELQKKNTTQQSSKPQQTSKPSSTSSSNKNAGTKNTAKTSGSSAKSYKGMTQERYNQLRRKGYTQKQIEEAYLSKAPEMTQDLYNKLRRQGYSQKQIEKGQYDREFLIPWQTRDTAGKDLGSWGQDIDDFSNWSSKTPNDMSKWDSTMATAWKDKFNKNAAQAKKYMQQLAAAGLSMDTEEYSAYKDYFDYFTKAAKELNKSNQSYLDYRKNFMYDAGYGQYLTYDQAKDMEKQLRNEADNLNNKPKKVINTALGGFIDPQSLDDEKSAKEKTSQADALKTWLAKQDEQKAQSDWLTRNLGRGQDSEQVYQTYSNRMAAADAKKTELESKRPDYYSYGISDELGNVYAYNDEAYNKDVDAWSKEYNDYMRNVYYPTQKQFNYASDVRDMSVIKNANVNNPQVRAIINRGKAMDPYAGYDSSAKPAKSEGLTFQTWLDNLAAGMGGNSAAGTGAGRPITNINNAMAYGSELRKHVDTSTWSAEKANTYYYLLGSGQIESAERFAKLTNDAIAGQQLAMQVYKPMDEWQAAHPVIGGVAATAAGIAVPLVTGIPEYLAAVDEYLVTGEINPSGVMPSQLAERGISNTAGQLNKWSGTINENAPVIGGKGAGDLYQVALSAAQSYLSISMAGGMEAATLAQFFGSAASSKIYESLDKGMDPGKALALGTMSGIAEAAGEKLSIENLIKIGDAKTARALLKDVLIQAGIEGSEEAFTNILNTLSDYIVNGDKNALQIAADSYASQGMSLEEANKQAMKDWLNEIGYDAVSGALSGAMGATGQSARANVGRYQGNVGYLNDLASQTAEGSRSRQMAEEYGTRDKLSAYRGNQYAAQVQEDLVNQNTDTAVRAIEQRLTELGETGNVHQKAQDIANAVVGAMTDEEAGGWAMRPSDQISATATANMRQVVDELATAREQYVDYSKPDSSWTDPIMKGRFLDQRILSGNQAYNALYNAERKAENTLKEHNAQVTDLSEQILEAKKELGRLSPTDSTRRTELNNKIREAEKELKSHQDAILSDGRNVFTEEQKTASVDIDGKEYKVSGLTMADGQTQAKLTDADGNTMNVSIDDERLPAEFRNLALKVNTLGWAASMAFEHYKTGTDIRNYIYRVQAIQAFASEKISREAFMNSSAVKALNDSVLAEFLYSHGQELYNERQAKVKKATEKLNEKAQKAMEKTGDIDNVRTKGKGKVDTISGWTMPDGTHYAGIQGKKLSTKQNAVVRMIDYISDALNLDYIIFDGDAKGVQGVYHDGGTIAININAGLAKLTPRVLAAETLSHELTHFEDEFAPEEFDILREAVVTAAYNNNPDLFEQRVQAQMRMLGPNFQGDRHEQAIKELVAEACTTMLQNSKIVTEIARQNMTVAQKMADFIEQTINKIKQAIADAFADSDPSSYRKEVALIEKDMDRIQQLWDAALEKAVFNYNASKTIEEITQDVKEGKAIDPVSEVQFSRYYDEEYMDKAIALNDTTRFVSDENMQSAKRIRQMVQQKLNDPKLADKLKLPEDNVGNTFLSNSSYGGSEENTTICVRSLAAQALMDEIAKDIGAPLTVEDTLIISQEMMTWLNKPECIYCYVATDRRAYRQFLGDYIKQRDAALKSIADGTDRQTAYKEFLDGRKNTKEMRNRFKMWQDYAASGELIQPSDLASIEELFSEIDTLAQNENRTEAEEAKFQQLKDAAKYAQSASWAKKMMGYTAYDNHILKWKQDRIDEFNKHYGLRMYSFSDYSPAFVLENMQMVTDAAVKGLKMLAYTKEIEFAKVFAPSGMNINVSVFASQDPNNGSIMEDEMMGAKWKEAIELREQYPNVGITLVATNDALVEWGLNNPNVDVVIPYHLVRTGQDVAEYFNYKNYTSVSADGKIKGVKYGKGAQKSVYPSEHQNDLIKYVDRLQELQLTPRFESYLKGYEQYLAGTITEQEFRDMNPTYMKLVNETRQSAEQTGTVQPIFDQQAALDSIDTLIKEGGYNKSVLEHLSNNPDMAESILEEITDTVKEKRAEREARRGMQYQQAEEYENAVSNNDMVTARRLVNQAAKDAGAILTPNGKNALHLYHGTPNFGFTTFKPGMIFLTDNSSISAGYTQNKGYGRVRQISESYTPDDGTTATLLKNIKNVLGNEMREATEADVAKVREQMRKDSDQMSARVNDLWTGEAIDELGTIEAYDQELENKLTRILALPGYINEYIDDLFNDPKSDVSRDILNDAKYAEEDFDTVRKFFVDHYKQLKGSAAKDMLKLFTGYDLIDFIIDAKYRMGNALDAGNMLINQNGSFISKESMRESVEQVKDVGSYDLYGFAGDNPLVIDGKHAFWASIEAPELGSGTFTTDNIGKLAQEKGYTSVQIKDIMDSSMNNYASNVYSDVYIFFSSNQVKSADPVTYDNDGKVIPLDQRFDLSNDNIQYQLADGETENAIYIKDGHTEDGKTVDFINEILDGRKKGETRTHKSLTRKWVGMAKDGFVYGRVRLGDPIEITNKSPEYKDAMIEGTEYDIPEGESKWYYPVLETEDFRDNPRPITRNGNYGQYQYQMAEAWDDGELFNNRALVSEETIDKWLTGSWFGSNTNENYAQAYIAYLTPSQYLRLTTIYDEGRVRRESDDRSMAWVKDVSEGQPIQLKIDAAEGKVYDHEGRHRMVVLDRNGVKHIPVLLFDMDTKYSKEPLAELKLEGQNFNGMQNYATTTVRDLIPLNRAHRAEIIDKFSKKTSFEKVSEKLDGYNTLQFQMADQEYMDAVNSGNTEEQQRMVDEAARAAGYTIRAYHGSPHTDISIFDINRAGENTGVYGDRAMWFTDSESFADEMSYQQLEGSSAFRSRRGSKGKVYDTYLKINRPFDVRNMTPAMRDLLWEMNLSKLRSMGMEPEQSSMGNRDYFFESIDAALEAGNDQYVKFYVDYSMLRDAGYDGIIARLFTNFRNDDSVEYGVFSPEQIKSADPVTYDGQGNVIPLSQRFNSEKPQIQYQMYDNSAQDSMFEAEERQKAWNDLQAENTVLEDTVTQLRKEIAKLTKETAQLRKTDKPEVRMNDARKMARQIIRDTRPEPITTRDKAEIRELTNRLSQQIKEIGDYILETGKNPNEMDYSTLRSMAQEIADDIVSNAEVEIDDGGATKDMRDQMRSALKRRAIFVPEQYRSDVLDWNDFKKRYRNIFSFKDNGTDIDIVYQSLLEEIPGLLNPNINNPGDMLNELADKWDLLQPKYENPFDDFTNEAVNHYTNMILQGALDGTLRQIAPTYADRMNSRIEQIRNEGKEKVKAARVEGAAALEALRTEKNARIEEIRQQGIARKQEALAKERADKWERVEATREYYQEMAKRATIRRKNSETRTKVKKLIADLNSRLTHPTERKYVPADLVNNTIKILEMIDLDTGKESVRVQERIALLQQQYAALNGDPTFAGYAYDPVMEEAITNMARQIGNTPLRKMSSTQLDTVYNTLRMLEHTIRTAVKDNLYGEEWNFYEAAKAAVKATKDNAGTRNNALGNAADWYTTNTMRPQVVFERFGGFAKGSEWEQIYEMLDKAQRYGMDLQMKFAKPFEELLKNKKELAKLTSSKESDLLDIGLKDENGETIKVTRDFMLFVYMNLFNEDNIQHVMRGGIECPELKEYLSGKGDRGYGKGSRRAVGISPRLSDINHAIEESTDANEKAALLEEKENLLKEGMEYINTLRENIEKKLTDYDKKWVQAWWQFERMSSEVLNDTSMQVYGFKKFIVEQYFPIITDRNFLNVPMDTIIKDMSLENAGFTKERIHASTPIKMMGLSDVINMQANRTAQYAAMMPAIRAFNKIYNKTMPGYSTSVKDTLNKKFGDSATKFVENLMADLQGGRRADFTIFDRLRGRMAQATLSLNPRVALAQTASFPTAAAELGWKPVLKALARGGKNNMPISAADRELIAKWSSALWYRSKGGTVELGDVKNMQQASHKVMDKLGWAMNWIEFMDSATVGRLWYAAQYYVDDNFKALQKGSDAYYEKVAEAFNRTIENTQPNYTTLQRPELLRNPDALIRQISMFMTQRLQNQSILYGAAAKYLKYRADYQAGKNGVTQDDLREMRLKAVNAATSQVAAAACITVFKFLADMLLHRANAYRRKEDKTLDAESISLAMLNIFAESLVSNMWLGSELYSAAKSMITKETYYGMELSGVSTLTETVENIVKFGQKPSLSMAKKLGESLSQFLGIPAANAEKIGQSIWYWMQDAMNGELFSFEAGVERTDAMNAKLLTEAYTSGDKQAIEKYSGTFEDDDDLLDSVRSYIKTGYVSKDKQTISKPEAIKLLVQAGMRQKDAEAKVQEWTCELVTGIPFSKIKEEYMAGNITQARVTELLQKYGSRDKETAERTARSYACEKDTGHPYTDLKEAYILGEVNRNILEKAVKKYGGMNAEDTQKKLYYYDYLKENPTSDISENRAVAYMTKLKPAGIRAKDYEDILNRADADKNGSYSQAEVGSWLTEKGYNAKQADALWSAMGPTWKTGFDAWQVKYNADMQATGKGSKNGNVSQRELGPYLVQQINAGKITMEQAEGYWKTFFSKSSTTFKKWLKKNHYKIS